MEDLHDLDSYFLDDDVLSGVASGPPSDFFHLPQHHKGDSSPTFPHEDLGGFAPLPPKPPSTAKEKKSNSSKGRGAKKAAGKEAGAGSVGSVLKANGQAGGGGGDGGGAEGGKGGKKRGSQGDGAGAPTKKAKTGAGGPKAGNAGSKQSPGSQAVPKAPKEKKPPKSGANAGNAKSKSKTKGQGRIAELSAFPKPVARRAPSDVPTPPFYPYAELPPHFTKQHRDQPSFLRALRDFSTSSDVFLGQHKELLMQDLRRAAEIVSKQKVFLENQIDLLDTWTAQAWPPEPSHVPNLMSDMGASDPGLPPGLAFDPSQADDWFLLDDDSMDNLFKDDGGMDFLEDIAAMVGNDHGPSPAVAQAQDSLKEKPPPQSPRPPVPSPRPAGQLIKVRVICESIGMGRGADNKVALARLPSSSQQQVSSPYPQAPPQVPLLPMGPPLPVIAETPTKGKGKAAKGSKKEGAQGAGATPGRKRSGPGRPPKNQQPSPGVGQAADKPEEVADRDTAPVTDRLDRYCDLESSSDRLWDYLQEGMFLMPITDVLTAQSNVTMAERMVSERLPLEPFIYVDRDSISKDVDDEEFDEIFGRVMERPLGNRGMTSPSRTDWDPMTDVVPEELEASYNQTLRYNPVLRRLLAAFVTPVHHPPPPSPTREDLPKGGRGKGAKSRGGAANKRKKEGPSVDDDSWGTSGEFELDWIDPETTCSKASPPTTPVKEEKDHRGQNGGASPSASLGTPSALAISVTSTPTKQLSSPIRPTPLDSPVHSRRGMGPTLDDRLCTELECLGIFEPFDRPRIKRMRPHPEAKDLLDAELAMSIRQDERQLNRLVRQSNRHVAQLRSRILEAYKAEVQENAARPLSDHEILDRYYLLKKEKKQHTPSKTKLDSTSR